MKRNLEIWTFRKYGTLQLKKFEQIFQLKKFEQIFWKGFFSTIGLKETKT